MDLGKGGLVDVWCGVKEERRGGGCCWIEFSVFFTDTGVLLRPSQASRGLWGSDCVFGDVLCRFFFRAVGQCEQWKSFSRGVSCFRTPQKPAMLFPYIRLSKYLARLPKLVSILCLSSTVQRERRIKSPQLNLQRQTSIGVLYIYYIEYRPSPQLNIMSMHTATPAPRQPKATKTPRRVGNVAKTVSVYKIAGFLSWD